MLLVRLPRGLHARRGTPAVMRATREVGSPDLVSPTVAAGWIGASESSPAGETRPCQAVALPRPERIRATLIEAFQLVSERAREAGVIHNRDANYFNPE
jgi:hypothetical protein